ncbi:hypothetical protein A3A76_03660 [Candidatus Woesebacteria bacterium RIFCSPLOWO2_01_FULL_39_23]|uniref:Glycosyltransferase RgtA/B/C/D-like domain-containing protein n=1 Tax=Candidatus Woesebacteria bacterium RIFCSPHIGHO2_01_FULL_40_22 TaxID=1802499 RepID=A0A1F7YJM3_9BACT|nr:MAG: hypothetical protein A2141_00365 [Candidatus Woesebacteria bacterium RBG_16_40_11]OGM27551.1 MAG: hypothetical protein A2628_02060 [Candidatus Woesebacteria bacterium RIFCSPHIGHO2_01_FULL_40_22]OGM62725.1 MAG: hypothetical protein A3A76_03660 [Candidatus Woesebacteria bacterium RIFCSPLOWO2_01_FULL_39_23]
MKLLWVLISDSLERIMVNKRKKTTLLLICLALGALNLYFYLLNKNMFFLGFSDAAKFADIARSVVTGEGYTSNFTFFNNSSLKVSGFPSISRYVPPLMPFSIASSFKLFGVSDISVIIPSVVFFLSLIGVTYLLGSKLWGNLVGVLSATAIVFNNNILDYAVSGASESLFIFEIVLASLLLVVKNKRANIFALIVIVAMYFTRPQAIIYIFGFLLLFLLLNKPLKKAVISFLLVFIVGSVLFLLNSKQGFFAITQQLPSQSASDALRGLSQQVGVVLIIKKFLYNVYNFYRLLPQIASPYLWALFIIGMFKWSKSKTENVFKISVFFMVTITFLVASITVPFFRYIHPIVPLIYIVAVVTLVQLVSNFQFPVLNLRISKSKFVILTTSFIILLFAVGQTLGVIFLDSRFERKTHNVGKPPVYVLLSWKLKDITEPDQVIVTNLDTWGTWYGERKTVWFPLTPSMLDIGDSSNLFDAIYLTSYLMDDENYYMGSEWRQIFLNPDQPEDKFIRDNYVLKGLYGIDADDNYENEDARAVLLVKK